MASTTISLLFLLLAKCKSVRTVQCYEGEDSRVELIEVETPWCLFAIECLDESCRRQPRVIFGKDDGQFEDVLLDQEGDVCYTERSALVCFCYGHRCNGEAQIQNLLAKEYMRGSSLVKRILNSYVHHLMHTDSDMEGQPSVQDTLLDVDEHPASLGIPSSIDVHHVTQKTSVDIDDHYAPSQDSQAELASKTKNTIRKTTMQDAKANAEYLRPLVRPLHSIKQSKDHEGMRLIPVAEKEEDDSLPGIFVIGGASLVMFVMGFAIILGIMNLVSKGKMKNAGPKTNNESNKNARKYTDDDNSKAETFTTTGVDETSQSME